MIKKKNKKREDLFKFISERPKDGGLLFGHDKIVSTLERIVLRSPESFTIGIYGGWGSGKSSIAETLQTNLKKNNVPLIIFDVWKHEGDALRRTFLKDLDKKLSGKFYGTNFYKAGFELEKNLESEINIETKDGYEFKGKKFSKHILVILLFIIVPLILVITGLIGIGKLLSIQEFSFDNLFERLVQVVGGLTLPAIFWFKFFNSFIVEKKTVLKKQRIQDPIEFENSFHSILNNLTDKVDKIVIVFDNLDRVSGEKAVRIISTIKTFLEPVDRNNVKDIVFIIPCDSEAIKKHLESVFGNHEDNYADEFLRKFFNTIVWIPEFYDTELQKLAFEKLAETKVPNLKNLDLAALITLVFDQNPRQIIQFINILLANYLLLDEQNIPGYLIKDNVTQLAKYLLLKQKFPKIMEAYREFKIYNLNEGTKDLLEKYPGVKKGDLDDFYDFLELTKPWMIESLDLFFKFRLTAFEAAFENSTRLIELLQSNRVKDILTVGTSEKVKSDKEYLDSLKISNKIDELSNIVKQKVKSNIYPLIVVQFVNGLLYLTKHYNIALNDDAYRSIYNKFLKENFRKEFYRIDVNSIKEECINKIQNKRLKSDFSSLAKKLWLQEFDNYHKIEKDER